MLASMIPIQLAVFNIISWNISACLKALARRWMKKMVYPCPTSQQSCDNISLELSKGNTNAMLFDNSSNKTTVKCYDTLEVTCIEELLRDGNINADLSSWYVLAVTKMTRFFNGSVLNGDVIARM